MAGISGELSPIFHRAEPCRACRPPHRARPRGGSGPGPAPSPGIFRQHRWICIAAQQRQAIQPNRLFTAAFGVRRIDLYQMRPSDAP